MNILTKANPSLLTVLVGALGILLGTLISPFINHRLTQRYNRRDLFFKKKLEYFERIVECIEKNIRLYKASIYRAEQNAKKVRPIIETLKRERKNFLISSSPLYFDTLKLSRHIKNFTRIERRIFIELNDLKPNKKIKESVIEDLKKQIEQLKQSGNEIIFEIRKEIKRSI